MHWQCDDRSTVLGLGSPTCSLLSNNLHAVADIAESVILLYYVRSSLQHQQVKSPKSKSSCASMVSPDWLYRPYSRTCSQQSVFFRVHPLSVRELTFTCMRGSVIFSNMLDFAVCVWTTCLSRLDKPLVTHNNSVRYIHLQHKAF